VAFYPRLPSITNLVLKGIKYIDIRLSSVFNVLGDVFFSKTNSC